MPLDFSKLDDAQWSTFQAEVENLDVGVLGKHSYHHTWITGIHVSLVNNVGRSHSFPSDFIDAPVNEVDDILAININSLLKVTRIVLPGMIQRYAFPKILALQDI